MKGTFHHIEIYVKNIEITKAFWGWLLSELGYELYQKWESGISYKLETCYLVFVQVDEKYLHLDYHRCGPGLNHLAFHGGNKTFVDNITKKLSEKGVKILYKDRHPFAGGPGYYAVFFEDPDRMKIEITAD